MQQTDTSRQNTGNTNYTTPKLELIKTAQYNTSNRPIYLVWYNLVIYNGSLSHRTDITMSVIKHTRNTN